MRSRGKRDAKKLAKENEKVMSKSNSSKDQRRLKEAVNAIEESQSNPYSWYSKFPQFTKDAGTLPFGLPVGQALVLPNGDAYYAAGVMRLCYYPTIGYSADLTSPVNRSAIRFYTNLRDVQKAAAKYDSADIMMYLMALDSCYAFWAMLRRIYGIAQLFTPINKYYPTSLLKALGVNPDIANNLAQLRAYINTFALSLSSYAVPADFDITARHMWMNEGLYLDSTTTRAQTYVFVPEGFWRYNNLVTTGSQLEFVPWMTQGSNVTPSYTLDDIMKIGASLINAILGDQDTGNISGDLYRAYGDSGVRKLPETPDMYSILPIYDQTVLSQIENATIMGQFDTNYTPVITQDPSVNGGAILFQPEFTRKKWIDGEGTTHVAINPFSGIKGALINMHVDSPTPEQVIEATRLVVCDSTNSPVWAVSSNNVIKPNVFGADIVSTMSTFQFVNGTSMFVWTTDNAWYPTSYQTTGEAAATGSADVSNLFTLMSFDWCPMVYFYSLFEDTTTKPSSGYREINLKQIGADIDNLTYATAEQINNMHTASMYSLFDVPTVAQSN